ncbi:type VI secretion protein [Streptomyces sp. NPDC087420]|uniref:type VI secretion protein n=1 Tax=Streptomyces sp. NPDC087420 TaxID=3365785 RepID=UPI00383629F2
MERHQGRDGQQGRQGGVPDGLLVGLLAFLLGFSLLTWSATGFAGVFAHRGWPDHVTFARTPLALRQLATAPHDLPAAWPDTPPGQLSGYGLFWGLLISQLMVLTVLTVFALGVVTRWRAVRSRRREQLRYERETAAAPEREHPSLPHQPLPRDEVSYGPGKGSGAPVAAMYGPAAGQYPYPPTPGAEDTRPLAAPKPAPAPASGPVPVAASVPLPAPLPVPGTTPQVVYGTARTRRPTAVQAVLDAEGPALVVTSDPGVWAETKDARAKLGPVLVYDPGHLCDTPARLHWSPAAGCENPDTAAARAAALLAPVRPRALLDTAMADTAETLLRCWLHAAAVDARPFKQVHRWAQGAGAHEAVRILRTHPKAASGLAGLLESALTSHPERREVAQQLTARTLAALSSIHIREACTPNRTDSLTLDSFADEGGTLYVVGEPIEDPRSHPGAMPLLTALTTHVVEHGRRMAARSSDGRLDPPMSLVLDDVAAVAHLPLLPELLATGQDRGLPTLALLRSREQARDRWPHHELPG